MIIVKGRELLIPENERYIGTTYDDNSTVRTFRIPRFHEDGMDKSQLDFYVIINYDDGSGPDAVGVTKSVSDDYIVLEWDVGEDVTEHRGCLFLWVRGFDYTGAVRWSSFPGAFYIEGSGTEPSDLSDLEQRISEEDKLLRLAKLYKSQPMTAATVAEMKYRDRIYVYVGSEEGYTYGNWYFWDEDQMAWVSGGVYNSAGIETDKTLTLEDFAADAKAVGEEISEITTYTHQNQDTKNAGFPSVCLHNGVLYGASRSGSSHSSTDGIIEVYEVKTNKVIQTFINSSYDLRDPFLYEYGGNLYCTTFGRLASDTTQRTTFFYNVESGLLVHSITGFIGFSKVIEYNNYLYFSGYDYNSHSVVFRGTTIENATVFYTFTNNSEVALSINNDKLYALRRTGNPGQTDVMELSGDTFVTLFSSDSVARCMYVKNNEYYLFSRIQNASDTKFGTVGILRYSSTGQLIAYYLLSDSITNDCGYCDYDYVSETDNQIIAAYYTQTGTNETTSFFKTLSIDDLRRSDYKKVFIVNHENSLVDVYSIDDDQNRIQYLLKYTSPDGVLQVYETKNDFRLNTSKPIGFYKEGSKIFEIDANGRIKYTPVVMYSGSATEGTVNLTSSNGSQNVRFTIYPNSSASSGKVITTIPNESGLYMIPIYRNDTYKASILFTYTKDTKIVFTTNEYSGWAHPSAIAKVEGVN